jgi:hypothetical protein
VRCNGPFDWSIRWVYLKWSECFQRNGCFPEKRKKRLFLEDDLFVNVVIRFGIFKFGTLRLPEKYQLAVQNP